MQMNMMKSMKGNMRERNTEHSNRERYSHHYNRFIENDFTYNTHQLLKKISQNGQKEPHMYGVPLYKIMLEVVKIMMMNELETLFLGSTLQEMKWKITDPCLNQYVNDAQDITPSLQKDSEAKKVQFSLLLISYIVKMYLNEDISLFDFKIREIIRNGFDRMYQTWVNRVSSNFRFNPKNMNKIFKQYDTHTYEQNTQIIDYNKLVTEYFRQTDLTIYEEREQEAPRYPQEQMQQQQQFKPVRDRPSEHDSYRDFYRNSAPTKMPPRKSQINELPVEEEEDLPPQGHERRQSSRLSHKSSQIGFFRRQSGNQFFAPENNRSGIFNLSMMRSSRLDDDDAHH